MSKVCMALTGDGRLKFSKYKPEYNVTDPSEPMVSRREFMDFARWLKYHVTEEDFPPDIRPMRTMFNKYWSDRNAPSRNLIALIRSTKDEEFYAAIARYYGKGCVLNKWDRISMFELPILYEEDLYSALVLMGLDAEQARFFAGLAAGGAYKNYCKTKKDSETLRAISEELHVFCTAAGGLPSRSCLKRQFPKQYEMYLPGRQQKDIDNENAFIWLKNTCRARALEKYKDDAEEVYPRLETELAMVDKQGSAVFFKAVFDALQAAGAKRDDCRPRGTLGASVIAYLLDISNIDPIRSELKLYPEFYFGPAGELVPSMIDLVVPSCVHDNLVRYFEAYSGNLRIKKRFFYKGEMDGVRIRTGQESGEPDAKKDFSFFFSSAEYLDQKGNKDEMYGVLDNVCAVLKPCTYAEKVNCVGIAFNIRNGVPEQAYLSGDIPFDELIAHREDVYEYMLEHGIDKENAFRIADYVRRGRAHGKGWDAKMLELMQKAEIPKRYIEFCEKITYLFPRAHDMMLVKYKIIRF